MRFTLILVALGFLLTGCSRRAHVVGTWHDKSGAFAFVFNPDGSFASGEGANHYAGTWRVSGEVLTMTLTNATGPHPDGKPGDIVQFGIVRANSHTLSLRIGGQTDSFSR